MVDAYKGPIEPFLNKLSAFSRREDLGKLLRPIYHEFMGYLRSSELPPETEEWTRRVREMTYDLEDLIDHFMDHQDGNGDDQWRMRLLGLGEAPSSSSFSPSSFFLEIMEGFKGGLHYLSGGDDIWGSFAARAKELISPVCVSKDFHRDQHEALRRLNIKIEHLKNKEKDREERQFLNNYFYPKRERNKKKKKGRQSTELEIMGIEDQKKEIISQLTEDLDERKVVSIVGPGGLGKTTLAQQVYNEVRSQYECSAFFSVSQNADTRFFVRDILRSFGQRTGFEDFSEADYIYYLQELLVDKRYLIVLDDIWSRSHWSTLLYHLPENDRGSRIITTTRLHDIARSCCDGTSGYIYKMNPLSAEDSRKLLFSRIFGSEDKCPDDLEKAAKSILKRCKGLPLAIITIGGLLANKPRTAEEWMKVRNSMGAADSNVKTILSISFYDLPSHLRTCMLYLSMFPEDHPIGREQLVWKWIAEGFITAEEGSTLEQVANIYFNQLISRNMIQAVDIQYDGTAKYCRVHDMILELILSISDKLNFCTIQDHKERKCIPQKIYRLSYQSYSAKHALQNISSDSLPHIRSFKLFGPVREVPYLRECKAMRVLDLGQCKSVGNNHIKIIVQLFLLKYLGLSYTKVTELPEEIGNLKHLQTLDLRGCEISKMPGTVARLKKLQHLLVCGGVTLPDDIGNMHSLELLLSIYLSSNSIKFIEELGKLVRMRRLEMTFGKPADMANEVRAYTDSLVSSLNKLANLETLNIQTGENSPLDSMKDICPTFFRLRKLVIGFISNLPGWIGSLKSLVHLEVQVVTMKKEDLGILEGISTLIYLELKLNCTPKEMLIVGNQGFECLEEFHLICSNDVIGLIFEAGAMPVLRKLHLGFLARKALSKDDGVFNSIGNLSGLENLHAEVDCSGSTRDHVDAIEMSLYSAAAKHLNKLTPDFQKVFEALMLRENEVMEDEEGDNGEDPHHDYLQEVTSVAPKILSTEDDEIERSF